jgi:hypothetical protein
MVLWELCLSKLLDGIPTMSKYAGNNLMDVHIGFTAASNCCHILSVDGCLAEVIDAW